ncbi:MAG TPA: hypothetical protein VFA04_14055 [Bryobacteraceae bacterium]|nr:hypothetical protein [Bryobacteraceae bacterium]
MNQPVKAYVSWVAAVGSVAIGAAVAQCQFSHPVRFPVFFALAFVASMLKIRFPAVTGTFSCSCLFVVLGIAELDRTEAMLIAIAAAAGQTLLNVRGRATLMQLVFNVAALGISTSAASLIRSLAVAWGANSLLALLSTAAVYYAVNVLIVSGALALLHAKNMERMWHAWIRWTTPAFIAATAAAAGLFLTNPMFHWNASMLFVPAVVVFQVWYRRLLATRFGIGR